ncbi:hypothetical protein Bca52824_072615 [Brassica carinata]|uniref:Uncharacterized protein n=1 Tax=Brassica carinata TaxID=52824 RepID=A0A8X7U735_BRACI|nr:hypothetical protein Bca52824_072615 [Brassica carinata]
MVVLQLLLSTTVNQIGVLKSGSQIRRCFSPPTSRFDIYNKSHCICNVSLLSTTFCIESQEVYRREKKKHRGAFMQINGFPSWQLQAMVSKDEAVRAGSWWRRRRGLVLVQNHNTLGETWFSSRCRDLTGSGVSSIDTNNVTIFAHYSKPLFHFFESLKPTEKVGLYCMSYAMEMFPTKISKAVFISAAMLANGQSTLDLFNQKLGSNDLMQQAQIFLYANGKKNPPTAADFDRSLLKKFIFNQSPPKDIALASVYIRPIPFAPVGEKLHVFYIKTMEDYAVSVFELKGSDHAPVFSRSQSLNRFLIKISHIPFKKLS